MPSSSLVEEVGARQAAVPVGRHAHESLPPLTSGGAYRRGLGPCRANLARFGMIGAWAIRDGRVATETEAGAVGHIRGAGPRWGSPTLIL